MNKYKITMYYVNGAHSFTTKAPDKPDDMVELYNNALKADTITITGEENVKYVINSKNIIFIQIELLTDREVLMNYAI